MASSTVPQQASGPATTAERLNGEALRDLVFKALQPLASLRLTVVLFAMSIFIVFAGTLAQTQQDIWDVVAQYFRTPIAWIPFQIFFPKSFFPDFPAIRGGIYFPGGWLIGLVMALNLIAAHMVRFKIQARGARLKLGLAVIAAGIGVTWLVIAGGSSESGMQGEPLLAFSTLWTLIRFGLLATVAAGVWFWTTLDRTRTLERRLLLSSVVGLGAIVIWLFLPGNNFRLGDSSMRIMWQLIQGGFAGAVLLAGCALVFRKRAGIVLLHSGVGLMMLSELLVGTLAVEAQMHIQEGETVNFVQDIRSLELAVIDRSDKDQDHVVVIPQSVLKNGAEGITHPELPFDVKLVQFIQNGMPRQLKPGEQTAATAGTGLKWAVDEARAGTGTDSSGAVDMSAAYVQFLDKQSHKPIATHLLGLFLSMQDIPETVTVGDKTYDVFLRFKRTYKPYSFTLKDVRFDKYIGTETAKNYSSELRVVDPTRNVDRDDVHIWMNNPLRFAGETFYQSSYNVDRQTGAETTGLQVVSNTGWMIPYVSCMIVAVGLLAQFSIVLLRFLRRREGAALDDEADEDSARSLLASSGTVAGPGNKVHQPAAGKSRKKDADNVHTEAQATDWWLGLVVPALVVVVFAGWLGTKARPPRTPESGMAIHEFGKLPVIYEGRVKPLDTLARNSLRMISNRESIKDSAGKEIPAIQWLLDVITGAKDVNNYPVFRIENLELLDTFGLERRAGFLYSVDEVRQKMSAFEKQAELAHSLPKEKLSVFQRKVLQLEGKFKTYLMLMASFQPPAVPQIPTGEDFQKDPEGTKATMAHLRAVLVEGPRRLKEMHPPLAVPVKLSDEEAAQQTANSDDQKFDWQPYAAAWANAFVRTRIMNEDPDPATMAWNAITVSYANGDAATFNKELASYQSLLEKDAPSRLDRKKTNFEAYFNHFAPFYHASVLYVIAFVLSALAWLGWKDVLNRSAFWLIIFTLGVHTFALVARIYISGRPPVTNLYSSAVFIGWGCVILGLVLEAMFKLGIGNVIAAVTGFAALLISHFLAGDGDTFTVLQAVLDTQFWLATHVTCITLGYSTTFLAGMLGIIYILRGVLTPSLTPTVAKDLSRMIYGTLCFAIFFSFVGTVLGGLWADDSWGRFWGWDPKENGALIIVLWNALVLHARWGGMVKERGMAVLAVAGNIATAWSWFGVNELGVGLHSYGFTEGVLLALGLFVVSQLAIIVMGVLPRDMWWSFRRQSSAIAGR